MKKALILSLVVIACILLQTEDAEARRRRRRRSSGPPVTHPVVLWARTLSESSDREQRRVAACKLSQYTQPIYQSSVVDALVRGMKDTDFDIKVCCAKAMARAGLQRDSENIRMLMIERYRADEALRSTLVRAFIARGDDTPLVHDLLLDALKKSTDTDEQLVLLGYMKEHGDGSNRFVEYVSQVFSKNENSKVKRAAAGALGDRAKGQDQAIGILSSCVDQRDTPLILTCLAGLQRQAKKDGRAWTAAEKTVTSSDPDVVMASLDLIAALADSPNATLTRRLLQIVDDSEDVAIVEKAVNGLGVCGDGSARLVEALQSLVEGKEDDDLLRSSAALVLGKQSAAFSERPMEILARCEKTGKTQQFRSACQLARHDLEIRAKVAAPTALNSPAPIPPGQPVASGSTERAIVPAPKETVIKRP